MSHEVDSHIKANQHVFMWTTGPLSQSDSVDKVGVHASLRKAVVTEMPGAASCKVMETVLLEFGYIMVGHFPKVHSREFRIVVGRGHRLCQT